MKSLQLLTLCLTLVFCTTSCVEQLETDLIPVETTKDKKGEPLTETFHPKIASITDYCTRPGAIEKVVVSHTQYASVVHLDIFSHNGLQHIGRYSKNNPNALTSITFYVGMPLDGSYGCSILDAGTSYRIKVQKGSAPVPSEWQTWWPWPNALVIDGFTTLTPCRCSIRR